MRYVPIDAKRGYDLSLPAHEHERARKWWITCALALEMIWLIV